MADETQVTSALTMDRGYPLGNSEDIDGRRALHVKVKNKLSEAIPVFLTNPDLATEPINQFNDITNVASGSEAEIVSYTVPPATQFYLNFCQFSGENIAKYSVYIDSILIGTSRTYFGSSLSDHLDFQTDSGSAMIITSGKNISLTVIHNRPTTADFEGRIFGALQNV